MSKIVKKSALLKTSAATDVKRGGGKVLITGLQEFSLRNLVSAKQIKYKAEVLQIATAGAGSYTPAGGTKYTIKIINPAFGREGVAMEYTKSYSYVTPTDITVIGATAALQREAIHVALVALINADARNFVLAATSGTGTGFTITDDAGYYPARLGGASNGRLGAPIVIAAVNADGSGFATSSCTITTAAVYGWGVGARLAQDAPIMHNYTGNLISGELDAPVAADGTFAVSGQQYDAFAFQVIIDNPIPESTAGIFGFKLSEQVIFVDNGAGTATTNAAGFIAFEREALRLIFAPYKYDPSSIVDFFDNALIASATYPTTGAAITTTDNVVMAVSTGENVLYVNPQSTHTLLTPIVLNGGLRLILDATDEEGMELSAPTLTSSPKQFVVGSQEFSVYARITATDFRHLEEFSVGFREKTNDAGTQAYAATLAAYDAADNNFAVLGNATEAVSGLQRIMTSKEAGGVVSTSTGVTYTTAVTHDFEVRVLIDGTVKFLLDGVDKSSLQATAYAFDAGDIVIPFIITALDANVDAAPLLVQMASIPTASWRI